MAKSNDTASGTVAINGAQLYYEVRGTGHPLLLLHAGIADSRMWDQQYTVFSELYRTIRFDFRGYGRSNLPSGTLSNVDDVAELLNLLQIDQTYLLGCSFGGLVALDFTLAYPERVSALILAAPSISGDAPSDRIIQFWRDEEAALARGDVDAATDLNVRLWVDGPHRSPEQVDPAVRERVWKMQVNAFQIPEPDDLEERDLLPPAAERLAEVKIPTLIMVGDLDLEEKVARADQLVNELPQARKAVITGAAHMMSMEKPAEFNQLVLDFLDGLG